MRSPSHAKRYNFFAVLQQHDQPDSGHKTTVYSKVKKEKEQKPHQWLHKEFTKPLLAEIEAAVAGLYALIEPAHTPKVRAIYQNALTESTASISKLFPNFISLKTWLANGIDKSKLDMLTDMGLGKILALSYFFEEDDLHKDNIGIVNGVLKRIDFDMSAYSIISRTELRGPRSTLLSNTTEDVFVISHHDLNRFPKLLKAKPHYFPTISCTLSPTHGYSQSEVTAFSSLASHKACLYDVYRTFSRIILMPNEAFYNTIGCFFGTPEEKTQIRPDLSESELEKTLEEKKHLYEQLSEHFISRKMKLQTELMETKRFRYFWQECHEEVYQELISEVEKRNAALQEKIKKIQHDPLRKEKYETQLIAINAIKKQYDAYCNEMTEKVSHVEKVAEDLVIWLEQPHNKKIMIDELEKAKEKPSGIIAQMTTAIFTFMSTATTSQSDRKKQDELELFLAQISQSAEQTLFPKLLSQLLSTDDKETKDITKKWLTNLLPHIMSEQIEPEEMDQLSSAVRAVLQPAIESVSEDGWSMISHHSSQRLTESFSTPH